MYEGGLRVPLIARWPGRIEAGQVSEHPCYFADVMPTLADFAGAALPARAIDGISIAATLLGRAADQKKHAFMYWEWHTYNWGKQQFVPNGLRQAVRMGDWKAVRHKSDEPFELYDLSTDIGETTNVAAEHPEIVRKIEAFIARDRQAPPPQIEPDKPEGKRYR
jgi:arylsulfatase A-like enzyme